MESRKDETMGVQEDHEEEQLLELQEGINKTKLHVSPSEMDLYDRNQQSDTNKLAETQKNLAKAEATVKERKTGKADFKTNIPEVAKVTKELNASLETVGNIRLQAEKSRNWKKSDRRQEKVIDALMDQQKSGNLKGIYGRLGNLCSVDEKYDVALITACDVLDHIVVDTTDTAQKCEEFLTKSEIGSASFISLDKMQPWVEHTKRKITTPKNIPRLFDLVRTKDDKILPALYFALRDTLVAEDRDQAFRKAYGRTICRVVTLQGEVIDSSAYFPESPVKYGNQPDSTFEYGPREATLINSQRRLRARQPDRQTAIQPDARQDPFLDSASWYRIGRSSVLFERPIFRPSYSEGCEPEERSITPIPVGKPIAPPPADVPPPPNHPC